MVVILYVIVILCATCLGAIAGLGGGIIIKPLLDAIGYHDVTSIGMYASIAVFTMCVVSLAKQIRSGFDFDRKVVFAISAGSLVGGLVGESIFSVATASLDDQLVKAIQAGILALTLVAILVYTLLEDRMPHLQVTSPFIIFLAGLALGAISVFLGIGGGPLNVAAMSLLFSFDMKQSTVYSLATIFFSQLSKLVLNVCNGTFATLDLMFVPAVVIPAVVGGLAGTALNRRMSDAKVKFVYVAIMAALLALSLKNCLASLSA